MIGLSLFRASAYIKPSGHHLSSLTKKNTGYFSKLLIVRQIARFSQLNRLLPLNEVAGGLSYIYYIIKSFFKNYNYEKDLYNDFVCSGYY